MRPAISRSASPALNRHLDSRPAIELRQVPQACERAKGMSIVARMSEATSGISRFNYGPGFSFAHPGHGLRGDCAARPVDHFLASTRQV
jgi:hypothetical protein